MTPNWPKKYFYQIKKVSFNFEKNFDKKNFGKKLERGLENAEMEGYEGENFHWKFEYRMNWQVIKKLKQKKTEKFFQKKMEMKKKFSKFSREKAPNGNSVKLNYN